MSRVIYTGKPDITDGERSLRSTGGGKLIFTTYRGRLCALLISNDRLKAVRVIDDNASKIGGIYIGKVKNIVKNIEACFVEIAEGELCFLSLKGIKEVTVLNRRNDGRILEGDEIPVQIIRDAQKTKQATVTTKLKLTKEEKERILQLAGYRTCFSCLLAPKEGFVTALEELVTEQEYEEIVTDDAVLYEKLKTYFEKKASAGSGFEKKLRLYEDEKFPLSKLYSLESKMDTALSTRVWLKSGSYLVIEPTEALTVIDVNSGKIDTKKSNRETIYRVNCEAAAEVALQLRLRNLSGIIIVDFINMSEEEDRTALMTLMEELAAEDTQKTVIVDMTALGLVEITRKKSYKTLREQFVG